MRKKSLTTQLLKTVTLPIIAVIIVVGILAYWSSDDEIFEVYDSQLITTANVLWSMEKNESNLSHATRKVTSKSLNLSEENQAALDEYAKWRSFRYWKNGKLIIASDNALPESTPAFPEGFTDTVLADGEWRVFSLYIKDENSIAEVAEKRTARSEIIQKIIMGLLLPLILSLPFIVLFIWKGIQWGHKDLRQFAHAIKKRSPDDLSNINTTHIPHEIEPLAEAINQLLAKLKNSLAQERLFTENAAHELRTPLAILSIQTNVIFNAHDDAERDSALQELSKGVSKASKLLDQLLLLARISHQTITLAPINLYDHAQEAIKSAYPEVLKKKIDISLGGEENINILSNAPFLAILLGNLIDNAIKHSPLEGQIALSISMNENVPTLMIVDNGSGIPENEYTNVFKRFYRLEGNTKEGSGLGLAIVQNIAEILDIAITLFTPPTRKGLGITLAFPVS